MRGERGRGERGRGERGRGERGRGKGLSFLRTLSHSFFCTLHSWQGSVDLVILLCSQNAQC